MPLGVLACEGWRPIQTVECQDKSHELNKKGSSNMYDSTVPIIATTTTLTINHGPRLHLYHAPDLNLEYATCCCDLDRAP